MYVYGFICVCVIVSGIKARVECIHTKRTRGCARTCTGSLQVLSEPNLTMSTSLRWGLQIAELWFWYLPPTPDFALIKELNFPRSAERNFSSTPRQIGPLYVVCLVFFPCKCALITNWPIRKTGMWISKELLLCTMADTTGRNRQIKFCRSRPSFIREIVVVLFRWIGGQADLAEPIIKRPSQPISTPIPVEWCTKDRLISTGLLCGFLSPHQSTSYAPPYIAHCHQWRSQWRWIGLHCRFLVWLTSIKTLILEIVPCRFAIWKLDRYLTTAEMWIQCRVTSLAFAWGTVVAAYF